MKYHSTKFSWDLWLLTLGFILITFSESLATVPNDLLTRDLVTKLSSNVKHNIQSSNLFGFNILNNNNPTPLGNA